MAALRRELNDAKSIAAKASATWDKFRKERDFHRMHHKRVAQEKNKLIADIKRLKVCGGRGGSAACGAGCGLIDPCTGLHRLAGR